ncbi:MAG: hypothetical protein CVU06_14600 [Bacteroidetes bacterium HGW-Bacteroidetes-22]|nr:MAG: hypothetical protein CVU06_14600 [Bacteroidetes bacterium HGW-Bacteroidetes-22]
MLRNAKYFIRPTAIVHFMKKIIQIFLIILVLTSFENDHIDSDYLNGSWQLFDKDSNYFEYLFRNDTMVVFGDFLFNIFIAKYKVVDDTLCIIRLEDNTVWKLKMKKRNINVFDLELTSLTINLGDTIVQKQRCNLKRIDEDELTYFDVKQWLYYDTVKLEMIFPNEYLEYLNNCSERRFKYYEEIRKNSL